MRLVPAALRAESRLTNLSQANQWSLPTSASLDRFPENVRIGAVVIPELELGHIEGRYLAETLWKVPTTPRLKMLQKPSIVWVWMEPQTY
jgi:hypothetical protein